MRPKCGWSAVSQEVEKLLSNHARYFEAGRLTEMTEHYVHPLAVFRDGKIRLRHSPRETADVLFEQRANVMRLGAKRVSFRYVMEAKVENGRLPIIVEWIMLNADDQEITRVPVRYFMARHADGLLRIEMLEVLNDPSNLLSQNISWRTEH